MRLLPHRSDGACPNGRCLRPLPLLWTDSHLTRACCRCTAGTPVASSTSGRPSHCAICPSLATATTILINGGHGRIKHTKRCLAAEACSRTVPSHQYPRWNSRPDALVIPTSITRRDARSRFSTNSVRRPSGSGSRFERWSAQSFTSYSRRTRPAEHDAHR